MEEITLVAIMRVLYLLHSCSLYKPRPQTSGSQSQETRWPLKKQQEIICRCLSWFYYLCYQLVKSITEVEETLLFLQLLYTMKLIHTHVRMHAHGIC